MSLRSLLRKRPDLVERVNELKGTYGGGDPDRYLAAKDGLYKRMLRAS